MEDKGTQDQTKNQDSNSLTLPVEWVEPTELRTAHANHLRLIHHQGEFYLGFYELVPPILLGEADLGQLRKQGSVRANCVARIVVSAVNMEAFVKVMSENLNNYKKAPAHSEGE